MNKKLLSICVTSYNRVNELIRCLESIDSQHNDIEIIISEDNSPQKKNIESKVLEFSKTSKYNIVFNSNSKNLGYDNNLRKLISLATSEYILFVSDDDQLISGSLDKILKIIYENKNYGLYYSPFYDRENNVMKRKYDKNHIINKGEINAGNRIFDAILFSGLIFKKEYINDYGIDFTNLNYFQVFVFLDILIKNDGYYINEPLIDCVGDGENAYGISESSRSNNLLANRKKIISNLEFHKGLIKVIQHVDFVNNTNIFFRFQRQYSLRSYTGLLKARKESKESFNLYWKTLNELDIKLSFITKIYYNSIKFFGAKITEILFFVPKMIFKR